MTDETPMDGKAANEGDAIKRSNSYRTQRPKARPRLKKRSGPIGYDKPTELLKFPPTPLIPKSDGPDWLEDILSASG